MDCDDNDPLVITRSSEDSDSDGVSDCYDLYPGYDDTLDSDNDGIPDDCDSCIDVDNDTVCSDVDCDDTDPQIKLPPEVVLENRYILCVNTNGTEEIPTPPVIDTGLSTTYYEFIWRLNGAVLPGETGSRLLPSHEGDYSVEITSYRTGCSGRSTTIVILSAPPTISAEVTYYGFIEDNVVEVTATGIGAHEYEYLIDDGPWQADAVFYDVSMGSHNILVRDLNGCGQTSTGIMVIDYPLFFTPNGDNFHDTWKIEDLSEQLKAKIYIFDRYGKLIKQLNPSSTGWDGTFNGSEMPANDYWFTLEFIEPKNGNTIIFKSHFTLKR